MYIALVIILTFFTDEVKTLLTLIQTQTDSHCDSVAGLIPRYHCNSYEHARSRIKANEIIPTLGMHTCEYVTTGFSLENRIAKIIILVKLAETL